MRNFNNLLMSLKKTLFDIETFKIQDEIVNKNVNLKE